jgi:pimeloyl-ACP methyl ester carboxylesterase
MRIDVNGVAIEVDDQPPTGEANGQTVLLLHGWPDTHALWNEQIVALRAAGYRTIAPDLRGFGGSDKPEGVEHYAIPFLFTDIAGVLDHLGVERVHVVGHDWGAALAWVFAILAPDRTQSVSALSVGHPAAFGQAGMAQREKSWYMLLFQFVDVAEQWLMRDGWANFRAWSRHPAADEVAARITDPADLTATLNLYRANVPPEALIGEPFAAPPITVPVMGIWSDRDFALTEAQMTDSAAYVAGPWRYEKIEGVDHWMTLEAPDRVSALLLDFLASVH